jgi:hypothetical protein
MACCAGKLVVPGVGQRRGRRWTEEAASPGRRKKKGRGKERKGKENEEKKKREKKIGKRERKMK